MGVKDETAIRLRPGSLTINNNTCGIRLSAPKYHTGEPAATKAALALSLGLAALGQSTIALCDTAADDLTRMSLADLAKVEVTSVSKDSEALQRAPAAIYVISHDDIARSGVTSVPEALRLAPNLLVTQTSSSAYIISARGFGGNPDAQNFSNKLLILIDGRSVYTPLYSGIYANTLDVMLEDVDRIEVISGVGATLWGANAMNGVINIITRSSYLTQGTFVNAGAGSRDQLAGARYGGRANGETTFRVYGFGFHRGAMELADGSSAEDGWSKGQGGFRADWTTEDDMVTVQGDFYRGTENQPDNSDAFLLGGNMVARYRHHGESSDLQAQVFIDQTEQSAPAGGVGFVVHTYDFELQQAIAAGTRNRIVWGGGERVYTYDITNSATLLFEPPNRALTLGNVFIQDTVAISNNLNLILGLKFEDDPFSGWTPLPDVRLSWGINDHATVWAAASRAIRSPTPFDTEVIEKLATTTFLAANPRFRPEEVRAYELGWRSQMSSISSITIAAFYNVYDDLRTVDPASATTLLPIYWGNSMRGDTYGIDAWGNWQVNDWWRLSPGVSWVRERLVFKPGAVALLGVEQAADDPSSHATLTSSMSFGHHLSFDASLRYVGALPGPAMPHYTELDARLGWQAGSTVELSLHGANLLHSRHTEFPAPTGEEITRSVIAEARLKF
ncbi:MAG TPA: TonB-dependent receptor [Bryobacteraceae bacterium]|nr:TonB-dependent receptor [Bryobacteraceae bacterium]